MSSDPHEVRDSAAECHWTGILGTGRAGTKALREHERGLFQEWQEVQG